MYSQVKFRLVHVSHGVSPLHLVRSLLVERYARRPCQDRGSRTLQELG